METKTNICPVCDLEYEDLHLCPAERCEICGHIRKSHWYHGGGCGPWCCSGFKSKNTQSDGVRLTLLSRAVGAVIYDYHERLRNGTTQEWLALDELEEQYRKFGKQD